MLINNRLIKQQTLEEEKQTDYKERGFCDIAPGYASQWNR